jgi:hypothetical protein
MRTRTLMTSLLGTLLTAGAAASADDTCQSLVATGETYFNGVGFEGSALTNLGDLALGDFGDRTVTVALLDQQETGTGLLATTAHTFSGPDGVFSTYDNARLVELSPGLYRLDTQGSIVDGAWGHITVDGLVDLRRGWARWYARGQVCGL